MPSSCKPEKEAFNRTVSHSRQSKKDHPLLEDWPTSKRRDIRKRVTFAQYGEIRLFDNSLYRSRKAYSSNDIEVMKAQGYVEARKIYDLISRFPVQTGTAIQSILGLGLLSPEQLVGLEHLVTVSLIPLLYRCVI